jgi:amidase
MRKLDFTPFDSAINNLDTSALPDLDTLTEHATIAVLHKLIKNGSISSVNLALFYLSRIRRFDADLHSIIELNPAALAEAHTLDALTKKGISKGSLHGMPILLKDNIATGDRLHTTAGALVLRDHCAISDATLVEHLRNAGALILGKTNMSEWAFAMSSKAPSGYSALGGQVINPFGASLEVAGSSTGSAVAVAARFASAAIGTETSGSIIAPASFNSVCGMRPTTGLVSNSGIIPVSSALDTAGPMAATVSDLAALLAVIATGIKQDNKRSKPDSPPATDYTALLASRPLPGLRFAIVKGESLDYSANDETMLSGILRRLEEHGCRVIECPVPDEIAARLHANKTDVLFADMRRGINAYLADNNKPVESLADIIEFNQVDAKSRVPYAQDLLIKAQNAALSKSEYKALTESTSATALKIIHNTAKIAQADILLSLDNHFSYFYSAAGVPAVTVPIGCDDNGQPHGATFVGIARNTDADVLAIAYAFEQSEKRQ